MVDNGIKPLYVFDGAPPKLKSGELAKRFARKSEATDAHEEAKETGTTEDVEKFSRRTVRVTREHNAECQKLLKLMGVPYIVAPTEAEAQCAVLARAGKVYAAASEDMDTLCFDSPILLRHLTFSEQRKEPILEIHLHKVLEGLKMDRKQVSRIRPCYTLNVKWLQFIDLCILLGCDYVDPIPKVGPNTALKLIQEHGDLESVVAWIEKDPKKRYTIPDDWPYKDARELFLNPDVRPADHEECDFKWEAPDVEGLVQFLVTDKGFSEDRVRSAAQRLQKNVKVAQQARLEGFFKAVPKTEEEKASLKVSHRHAFKPITLTCAAETWREAGRDQEEEERGDGEEESRQGQAKRYSMSDIESKCIMNGVEGRRIGSYRGRMLLNGQRRLSRFRGWE
jgi:flap endonuclease-1